MSPRLLGLCLIALSAVAPGADQQRGAPPPATGTAFLAGQIVDAASLKPVPGARVTLTSNRGIRAEPVFADSQGRFFFANLPAATYSFQAAMPGYQAAATAAARAIPLADGERYTVARLKLVRLASLSGTVRDEVGDPLTGTEVVLVRRGIAFGRVQLQRIGQTRTDDRGLYRFSGLRPGEYLVCACGRDPIPFDGVLLTTIASQPMQLAMLATRALKLGSDVAGLDNTLRTYPPTFFPSSTTPAQADRVTVTAGEERTSVDISVAAVPAARVAGTVTGASGPMTARWIRLVPAGEETDAAGVGVIPPMLVQPDGRFDFAGVPPGQYVLKVQHHPTAEGGGTFGPSGAALAFVGTRSVGPEPPTRVLDGPPYWAAQPITVSGADITGLSILLRPGPRLAGKIEFAGTGTPPQGELLSKFTFVFSSLGPDFGQALAPISADGTFAAAGALPGPYILSPRAFPLPGWSVKAATSGGVDVNDLPIDLTRDVIDLVITMTDAPLATLNGTISGRPLPLAEDLTALVFPSDRRYWANPTAASRRFRLVGIDRTGVFSVSGLPPGEYVVAVVPDDAAADWQEARRLEELARDADRVTLTEGSKITLTVRR